MSVRGLTAWALYWMGHGWYLVFDRWLPSGMPGVLYDVYNGLMTASVRVQGEGRGPWLDPL